jgi:hypothetical protein
MASNTNTAQLLFMVPLGAIDMNIKLRINLGEILHWDFWLQIIETEC